MEFSHEIFNNISIFIKSKISDKSNVGNLLSFHSHGQRVCWNNLNWYFCLHNKWICTVVILRKTVVYILGNI